MSKRSLFLSINVISDKLPFSHKIPGVMFEGCADLSSKM